MAIWSFNVTHKDQTTATGSKDINPPGNGQSVTINNVPCTCGYNHTLVGSQSGSNEMSGSGSNSVAPPNDPHSQGSPKEDDIPSWEGTPTTIDEDEDEEESDEDESNYEDNPDEKR